eukprot:3129017-Rhodomonas_salina.1
MARGPSRQWVPLPGPESRCHDSSWRRSDEDGAAPEPQAQAEAEAEAEPGVIFRAPLWQPGPLALLRLQPPSLQPAPPAPPRLSASSSSTCVLAGRACCQFPPGRLTDHPTQALPGSRDSRQSTQPPLIRAEMISHRLAVNTTETENSPRSRSISSLIQA